MGFPFYSLTLYLYITPLSMKSLKQLIGRIPKWAFLLVLLVNIINTLYFYYWFQDPDDGHTSHYENGQLIYDYINPGGPADKAGMKSGDLILSVNSIAINEWTSCYHDQRAGDTLRYRFLRNKQEMTTDLILSSPS